MAVYFATKAYVLHFSEAINNEVQSNGVTVTALCPGATETGFQAAGALDDSKLFKGKKLPSGKDVAQFGYDAMMKGKAVVIHGFLNNILARSGGLLPRGIIVKITRMMLDKVK
jgi:short-subunit dehydrogenase